MMDFINILKVLGEENRLRIVALLTIKRLCGIELEAILQISQTNLSKHICKLKQAKVICEERSGQKRHYSICEDFKVNYHYLYDQILEEKKTNKTLIKDEEKCYSEHIDCGCDEDELNEGYYI